MIVHIQMILYGVVMSAIAVAGFWGYARGYQAGEQHATKLVEASCEERIQALSEQHSELVDSMVREYETQMRVQEEQFRTAVERTADNAMALQRRLDRIKKDAASAYTDIKPFNCKLPPDLMQSVTKANALITNNY